MVNRLAPLEQLRACYEAGPTGYVLYWQLTGLGVHCQVIAPSLVPVKAGDRVKTDRRDAEKLARCNRAGELTPVWVPDAADEALRDLTRVREDAKQHQLRARHRLGKFLLRHGQYSPDTVKSSGHRNIWIGSKAPFTSNSPLRSSLCWITCIRWSMRRRAFRIWRRPSAKPSSKHPRQFAPWSQPCKPCAESL